METTVSKQEMAPDVSDLLHYTLNLFLQSAWHSLNLIPSGGEREPHLEEARFALECADFLAGKLREIAEPEVVRRYEHHLQELKQMMRRYQGETSMEA